MTKTSDQAEITVKDVFIVDFLPFLLSIVVMMPLLYGVGWLIGSADPRQGIPEVITFSGTVHGKSSR